MGRVPVPVWAMRVMARLASGRLRRYSFRLSFVGMVGLLVFLF